MLSGALTAPIIAQTNAQDKQGRAAANEGRSSGRQAQANADKKEHKAVKSRKVKKAAKAQDKANRVADRDAVPQ